MPSTPIISIVDDDDALRSSLEDLIRSVGFRVQGFISAEAFLRSNQVQKTDCLILDVRMSGMTGPELQRRLRSESPDLPIIFITAYADRDVQAQAFEAGRYPICSEFRACFFAFLASFAAISALSLRSWPT